jgi:hypothetical protein
MPALLLLFGFVMLLVFPPVGVLMILVAILSSLGKK